MKSPCCIPGLGAVLLLAVLGGCSRDEAPSAPAEPIRGKPLQGVAVAAPSGDVLEGAPDGGGAAAGPALEPDRRPPERLARPDAGGDAYGAAEPSAPEGATTDAARAETDAAGAETDAAGAETDAAGTVTDATVEVPSPLEGAESPPAAAVNGTGEVGVAARPAGSGDSVPAATSGDATAADSAAGAPSSGPRLLAWEDIASFEYEPPEIDLEGEGNSAEDELTAGDKQIPDKVKALQGQEVSIEGFMMPINVVGGRVKSFILARHVFGCCFGVVPKINEWVVVDVEDAKGVPAVSYDSVTVSGHLKVGGVLDEFGYVYSIYQISDGTVSARR